MYGFVAFLATLVIVQVTITQSFHSAAIAKTLKVPSATLIYMGSDEGGDAVSRRRQRRGRSKAKNGNSKPKQADNAVAVAPPPPPPPMQEEPVVVNPTNKLVEIPIERTSQQPEQQQSSMSDDGTASLEDLFGIKDDQLRELMEQELPVPREDLLTGKKLEEEQVDKNKVFKLPDLNEFMDNTAEAKAKRNEAAGEERQRVDRSNYEEYIKVLQLNPFADADDSLFVEEYDIFPSIFGSGSIMKIPVPYLQTGHGMLLIGSVLAAFVYAPGNPLTEFPPEIRAFLKTGLGVVYAINSVLAVNAFFIAGSKNLPRIFWTLKTFMLGGVSYYEVTQAADPTKMKSNVKSVKEQYDEKRGRR